jgi:hypothetical protein
VDFLLHQSFSVRNVFFILPLCPSPLHQTIPHLYLRQPQPIFIPTLSEHANISTAIKNRRAVDAYSHLDPSQEPKTEQHVVQRQPDPMLLRFTRFVKRCIHR